MSDAPEQPVNPVFKYFGLKGPRIFPIIFKRPVAIDVPESLAQVIWPDGLKFKRVNRERAWHWCPSCAMVNPRNARVRVDIGSKHCGACGMHLFTAFDSPFFEPSLPPGQDQYPHWCNWFMRLNNGPRGTGWYRRRSIELLYGQPRS